MITVKSTEKPTLKSIIEDLHRDAARIPMKKDQGRYYFNAICSFVAPLVGLESYQYWTFVSEKIRIREVIDIKHIAWTIIRSMAYANSCNHFCRQYPFTKLAKITGNDHSTIVYAVQKSHDLIETNPAFARIYYQGLKKMIELCTA